MLGAYAAPVSGNPPRGPQLVQKHPELAGDRHPRFLHPDPLAALDGVLGGHHPLGTRPMTWHRSQQVETARLPHKAASQNILHRAERLADL